MSKTKEELLEHYSHKKPNRFIQYDGFADMKGDSFFEADSDGHVVLGQETYELMHGTEVRVLIRPGTPRKTVCWLLLKILGSIVDHGLCEPDDPESG